NSGTIELSGNRDLNSDDIITFFYGSSSAPPASITIPAGKGLIIEGNATLIQSAKSVTVSGGSLKSTNLSFRGISSGGGTLVVNSGGSVTTTGNATLGDVSNSFGTATFSNSGSSWNIAGGLTVGLSGTGTLTVSDQALVYVGSALSINSLSTVNLQG